MSYRRACIPGKFCLGIAVLAASLMTLAAPASAQFSVEWVQLGGNFRVAATRAGSPNSPLCVHGLSCSCPGSRNYCGQHRDGAEVSFWKDGCNQPPLTIQCVIRPTGAGPLSGGGARPQGAGGGFGSGRYEMKTSSFTAIVNLNVNGNTFSGTADWNLPGQRQDPIIDGAIRNDVITFTRLCQASGPNCVQRFQGRLNGPVSSGFWTGSGGKGQIAWTMRRL